MAAGAALVALSASSTVTTPLWPGYEQRLGHGPSVTTLVFALYVLALVPAALVSSRVLGRAGPRRLAVGCLALTAGACALLWQAGSAEVLAVGRVLQGLGVGVAGGPLTAVLLGSRAGNRRAALASTALLTAGAGCGPVVAGALAGRDGSALDAVFGTTIGALALATLGAALLLPPAGPAVRRGAGERVPPGTRFWAGAGVSLLGWAVGYTVLAIAPSFATAVLGAAHPLVIGAPAGFLLLVSALTQLGAARLAPLTSIRLGCLVLALGLPLFAALARVPTAALLLGSLVVLGAGHGLAFLGALRLATTDRADSATTGRFFAITYTGGTAPVLAVGVLAGVTGVVPAVAGCALLAALVCLGVAVGLPRVVTAGGPAAA
ncbi:MFS transporter [Modestobacter sp. URMC 112]